MLKRIFKNRLFTFPKVAVICLVVLWSSEAARAKPFNAVNFIFPYYVSHQEAKEAFSNHILELEQISESISKVLGEAPERSVNVRLLDDKSFHEHEGIPSWASGMFIKKEILLPLALMSKGTHNDELHKTFRHEFTHALISFASNGKCPIWLDEGLAQMMEQPNSNLLKKRRRELTPDQIQPLSKLLYRMSTLTDKEAKAGYTQAYFSTAYLINRSGYEGVRTFFSHLKRDVPLNEAFSSSFGLTLDAFEEKARIELQNTHNITAIKY